MHCEDVANPFKRDRGVRGPQQRSLRRTREFEFDWRRSQDIERMEFVKKFVSTAFATVVALGVGVSLVGCGTTTTPSGTPTPTSTGKVVSTEKTTAKVDPAKEMVSGTYVSFKEDKITIKVDDKESKEFPTVKDLKPMIDGKEGKWDELKEKDKVTLTEKEGKVTKVEKVK